VVSTRSIGVSACARFLTREICRSDQLTSARYQVMELEIDSCRSALARRRVCRDPSALDRRSVDQYLYEEMLRAVVKPPFAMRTRLGYLYAFDAAGNVSSAACSNTW
jgi:hypothetical protein